MAFPTAAFPTAAFPTAVFPTAVFLAAVLMAAVFRPAIRFAGRATGPLPARCRFLDRRSGHVSSGKPDREGRAEQAFARLRAVHGHAR